MWTSSAKSDLLRISTGKYRSSEIAISEPLLRNAIDFLAKAAPVAAPLVAHHLSCWLKSTSIPPELTTWVSKLRNGIAKYPPQTQACPAQSVFQNTLEAVRSGKSLGDRIADFLPGTQQKAVDALSVSAYEQLIEQLDDATKAANDAILLKNKAEKQAKIDADKAEKEMKDANAAARRDIEKAEKEAEKKVQAAQDAADVKVEQVRLEAAADAQRRVDTAEREAQQQVDIVREEAAEELKGVIRKCQEEVTAVEEKWKRKLQQNQQEVDELNSKIQKREYDIQELQEKNKELQVKLQQQEIKSEQNEKLIEDLRRNGTIAENLLQNLQADRKQKIEDMEIEWKTRMDIQRKAWETTARNAKIIAAAITAAGGAGWMRQDLKKQKQNALLDRLSTDFYNAKNNDQLKNRLVYIINTMIGNQNRRSEVAASVDKLEGVTQYVHAQYKGQLELLYNIYKERKGAKKEPDAPR